MSESATKSVISIARVEWGRSSLTSSDSKVTYSPFETSNPSTMSSGATSSSEPSTTFRWWIR